MRLKSEFDKSIFFIPSILDSIFLILIIGIIYVTTGGIVLQDGDTGYHIRTGRYILENLRVPTHDFYSYTCTGKDWVAFSWGNDVIYAIADKIAGLNGVVILATIFILATLYIVYKLLLSWKINFFVLAVSLLIVTVVTSIHWLARPHLFTAFFTVLLFYLIEKAKDDKKYYYPMPFLILLWANIHPGFISGFFIFGCYFIGYILEYIFNKDEREKYKERIIIVFIVSLISLAFSFITPYGIKLHYYIYETLSSSRMVNTTNEYLSPNFHGTLAVIVYEISLMLLIIFGYLKSKRLLDMPKILLVIFWIHLSLFAIRNIVLYSLIAIPCLALIINDIIAQNNWESFNLASEKYIKKELLFKYHFWPGFLIIASILIALNNGYLFNYKVLNCYFPDKSLPVKAFKYLEKYPLKGNMLNEDNWGGFILYAYPSIKVFMDGRLDMYQEDFIGKYHNIIYCQPGWQKLLDEYKVEWIVFEKNNHFYNNLVNTPEWKIYYEDPTASILVRRHKKINK